jgi:hypothetical protein
MSSLSSNLVDSVSQFFGRPIAIEERCVRFLSRKPLWHRMLGELLISDPAILNSWSRTAKQLESEGAKTVLPLPDLEEVQTMLRTRSEGRIIDLLERSFRVSSMYPGGEERILSHTGDSIRERGTISCLDFALSMFDHAWFQIWKLDPEEVGEGVRPMWADLIEYAAGSFYETHRLESTPGRQLFVISADGSDFRFRPAAFFGGYRPASEDSQQSSTLFRVTVDESPRLPEDTLRELEHLMARDAREAAFQAFFEKHPEILIAGTGARYKSVHCQLVLTPEDGSNSLIPDFFLERLDIGMLDILDLKRANVALRRRVTNRNRFRDAVMDVVSQLERYRNFFEDRGNRQRFKSAYGLEAYRPRVIAIMGRDADYYQDIERVRLEGLLPSHFELLTYDEIMRRVRNLRSLLRIHAEA